MRVPTIELDELDALFENHLELPALSRGEEGLLEFEEWSAFDPLRECAVLSFGENDATFASWSERRVEPESVTRALGPYTLAHDLALVSLGRVLGQARPRLHYLWGNSD